jgi:hypothetical protein
VASSAEGCGAGARTGCGLIIDELHQHGFLSRSAVPLEVLSTICRGLQARSAATPDSKGVAEKGADAASPWDELVPQ